LGKDLKRNICEVLRRAGFNNRHEQLKNVSKYGTEANGMLSSTRCSQGLSVGR